MPDFSDLESIIEILVILICYLAFSILSSLTLISSRERDVGALLIACVSLGLSVYKSLFHFKVP